MLSRHIRLAGVRLIETLLSKHADFPAISAPTLASLKASKTRELNTPPTTATAVVPKVVTAPTT